MHTNNLVVEHILEDDKRDDRQLLPTTTENMCERISKCNYLPDFHFIDAGI